MPDDVQRGEVDEHRAQERQGDPDRADHDVLPRRLERRRGSGDARPGRSVTIVVASTATHITPRLAASTARSIVARKPWTRTAVERGVAWRAARRRRSRPRGSARPATWPARRSRRSRSTMNALSASARRTPPQAGRRAAVARPRRRARRPTRARADALAVPSQPDPAAPRHEARDARAGQRDAEDDDQHQSCSSGSWSRSKDPRSERSWAASTCRTTTASRTSSEAPSSTRAAPRPWPGRRRGRCRCRPGGCPRSGRPPCGGSPARRTRPAWWPAREG